MHTGCGSRTAKEVFHQYQGVAENGLQLALSGTKQDVHPLSFQRRQRQPHGCHNHAVPNTCKDTDEANFRRSTFTKTSHSLNYLTMLRMLFVLPVVASCLPSTAAGPLPLPSSSPVRQDLPTTTGALAASFTIQSMLREGTLLYEARGE